MDINQCPSCQNQYDQDRRVSKQLPCGCVSCLQCYKIVFQFYQEIRCKQHQQVYNISPEKLQTYVFQEQVPQQELPQPQLQFIDQELIKVQCRQLQDQYVAKQNHNREIIKVIQDCSQFMKHIQQLAIKEIFKILIEQFSMSKDKIKNLLQRLSELQVTNKCQQQQQNLILGQKDLRLSQNPQDQSQQQFQQILHEIDELKKDQWLDIQSLRVTVQRCMFDMFVYLGESSQGQLLTDSKAESLVQKYFVQHKVQCSFSQGSKSEVQQKSLFKSQSFDQQLSQVSQNIDQQNQQNQVSDMQQGQDMEQVKQFQIPLEISQQERLLIDARVMVQLMEQKMINLANNFSFVNKIDQLCCEQAMNIVPIPSKIITFQNLVQYLSQIKNENVSLQVFQFSMLSNSRLIEYPQVLQQLSTVTDQTICLNLIQVLNLSKNQPKLQQTATNALTILNYMNYAFANQDFSNLDLSNSDLSDTTFTNCNFSNSNLTQANLRNSKFIDCDFTSSNLTSIITEHPHIFTGHTNSVL